MKIMILIFLIYIYIYIYIYIWIKETHKIDKKYKYFSSFQKRNIYIDRYVCIHISWIVFLYIYVFMVIIVTRSYTFTKIFWILPSSIASIMWSYI